MSSLRVLPPLSVRAFSVLLLLLAACFAAAVLGSWFNLGPLQDWYPSLRKPTWTPPNWVFAPVWTMLYVLMALAAWLVWLRAGWPACRAAMTLFIVQLILNAAWSGLFFSLHQPGIAFAEIVVLWFAIAATLWHFGRISTLAAGLFTPYLLWVTFAAILNGTIWRMNA
jgi:benzodiazapine receptor